MINMMRKVLFYIAGIASMAAWGVSPVQAQRAKQPKGKATVKAKAEKEPAEDAEQLIRTYRFSQAARQLQRNITAATRGGRSTERMEADLQRANMGQDMLGGTEKVCFVDSFVVGRKEVLFRLQLSREAGHIVGLSELTGMNLGHFAEWGHSGFVNELGDRVIFAASDSVGKGKLLWQAFGHGMNWSTATPLEGLEGGDSDRDFPFMMPDGATLYFAAQGEESLGGYDIFVTRYDAETRRFLKPENVGMPFNSPANDYMMGVDESTGLGFFVTDRRQHADSVCVYVFLPNETREVYELTADNEKEVRQAAEIHSIALTQTDPEAVKAALQRMSATRGKDKQAKPRRYVINDGCVYTSLKQFRSDVARRIASEADAVADELDGLLQRQDVLQHQAAMTSSRPVNMNEALREIEARLPELRAQWEKLTRNMRKAELGE